MEGNKPTLEEVLDRIQHRINTEHAEEPTDGFYTDTTQLKDDLGLDSFDMIELIMWIEDEFKIDLDTILESDEQREKMLTWGGVKEIVTERYNATG